MKTFELQTALKYCHAAGKIVDNYDYQSDYETVLSFARLKGRGTRPIDSVVIPNDPDEFESLVSLIEPDFFEPFQRLLELVGFQRILIGPDLANIAVWNNKDYETHLISAIERMLDEGGCTPLVPALVAAFWNLEREKDPGELWGSIDVIAIPGSRTQDRVAEAFRAYLRTEGRATLVTSGRAPYYDPNNTQLELTEAEVSKAYLRLLGIPDFQIVSESESRDTQENAEFLISALTESEARRSAPVERILLVTSPFHLARYRFGVEQLILQAQLNVSIYAIGSRASRYWAETYFLVDAKSGYPREVTLRVVLGEYLKLAFDICAKRRPTEVKAVAIR
jgi:uncharacterized SAM-binding protein YcdF (DUF218 family)